MRPEYREEPCKTALNRVKGMPFRWSLNPYMGCAHRCTFCFVRAFERLADRPSDDRYGTSIRVKTNLVEVLRRELGAAALGARAGRRRHGDRPVPAGRGSLEADARCHPGVRRARTPFGLITRGPLIVRDLDVLEEAAPPGRRVGHVLGPDARHATSGGARSPGRPRRRQRLRALRALVDRGIKASVGMAPILPGLSDRPELMADVIRAARDAGATGVWANVLYLKPGTREHFLDHLARDWPELLPMYERLYARGAYADKRVVGSVKSEVAGLAKRHGIADRRRVRRRAAEGRPDRCDRPCARAADPAPDVRAERVRRSIAIRPGGSRRTGRRGRRRPSRGGVGRSPDRRSPAGRSRDSAKFR